MTIKNNINERKEAFKIELENPALYFAGTLV